MKDLSAYKQIIIWGAHFPPGTEGVNNVSTGRSFEMLYAMLENGGVLDKVLFIADSNPSTWGLKRKGIEVKAPHEIASFPSALVIINTTTSMNAVMNAMKKMQLENEILIISYYFSVGTMEHVYDKLVAADYIRAHENEIRELYDCKDKITKCHLDVIISTLAKGEDDLYTPEYYVGTGEPMPYFCDPQLAPEGDVTFIDVGAYIGDSIDPVWKFYGQRLKSCIAFEPDEISRKKLTDYVENESLSKFTKILPYALGNTDKVIYFHNQGMLSNISESGEMALGQKVFDDLEGMNIVGSAMIKMDIEGAEMGALQGMEKFIRARHPYLAICIYHKEGDIYDIPRYLKSLYKGYKFYIRGGWHLECWAVPEETP